MKTLRSLFNSILFFLISGFVFAGCYTRMETVNDEESGTGDYTYNDSTAALSDTSSATYFNDDGYRESQYRMSFDYYCPPSYVWGTGVWFDPWYGDYGYPWGGWYPTLAYPYPYWYGHYPYYGRDYGYWPYYGSGYRGGRGGNFFAGRPRTTGSTRGGDGFMRARGGTGTPGAISPASGVASSRTRTPGVPELAATNNSRTHSREEVPWWQRAKTPTAERSQAAGRNPSIVARARNAGNPSRNSANPRQVRQHNGRSQPAQVRGTGPQSRPAARQQSPHYSSPQHSSGGSGSSGGGSRSGGGGGGGRSRSR
jgi:hypothetical protein